MSTVAESRLEKLLSGPAFEAYTYAYPHKLAYRPLPHPIPLREVWRNEPCHALFLYVHVPFCEMRCGFCNLFTSANPERNLVRSYLAALRRQAIQTRAALGKAAFARLAFGGGTPTFLEADELQTLFEMMEEEMGVEPHGLPFSVETSPATATAERLALLRAHGVDRVSMGVQSFIESEVAAVGRSQKRGQMERALGAIQEAGFPTLNMDLIYGLPGQTAASWAESLEAALRYEPEEIFIYPLYVRALTGLGRKSWRWNDVRLELYRQARVRLLEEGYTQVSMRMFRAAHAPAPSGPNYCAQEDGMVGLGCGARSYTRGLHYAVPYAVGAVEVRRIIETYAGQPDEAFACADHGFVLDEKEQKRRYAAQTLLNASGVPLEAYERRFGSDLFEDLPELSELGSLGLARLDSQRLQLTDEGLERSDVIGPWFYSARVQELVGTAQRR